MKSPLGRLHSPSRPVAARRFHNYNAVNCFCEPAPYVIFCLPVRATALAAPTATCVGLALAALLAPPLTALAPAGIAPWVALLTAASLASGWRESVAAARPYAGLLVLLALISAWSAIASVVAVDVVARRGVAGQTRRRTSSRRRLSW